MFTAADFDPDAEWSAADFGGEEEKPEESRASKGQRLKAEMAEARKVPLSSRLLNTVGYLSDYVVDPVSKMNYLTAIPRAAHGAAQVVGAIPQDEPFPLDEDRPLVDLHEALVNPVVEAGSLVDELRYGTQQAAADVGQFFVTPRGLSALAAGGAPAAARAALASGFAGSMAAAVPEAYEATKEAFRGDSVSDKTRATLNLLATVGAPAAIAAGALKQGLKPAERLVPQPERTADARQIVEAEKVAQEVAQEVPAQVGSERISPPEGQAAQRDLVLAPEQPQLNVLPAARELAKQYEGKVGDLEGLTVDADAAASKAASDLQAFVSALPADKTTWTGPQRMEYIELAERVTPTVLSKQLHNEALQVLRSESAPATAATAAGAEVIPAAATVPPKTAVFNSIQYGFPQFKYFNEKTGRWNDVSAETAKQRGIEIPAEELAKAEAAQKGPNESKTEWALEAQQKRGVGGGEQRSKAEAAQPRVGESRQGAKEAGLGVEVPVRRSNIQEDLPSKEITRAGPEKTADALRKLLERERRRIISEEEGQAVLDSAEDAGRTPNQITKDFFDSTWFKMSAGEQAKVIPYLKASSGNLKPGDVIGTKPGPGDTRIPWIAEKWSDVIDLDANRIDQLQGSNRGLASLMEFANQKYGEKVAQPAAATQLGAQLAAGIPDPVATAKAVGELVQEGVTMAKRVELINKAIGKPKEAAPPIKTEVDTPLPDFNEHGASKKIFSQPFGFERLPVIGALFGGTRRLVGHVNESLTTYWAERQIGRSISSAFGSEYSWLNKPFEIKDGQITNITPAQPGASRYISDVFESLQKDPNSYKLNAEQQKAFDAIQKLEKDFSRLEDRYKIGKGADNEVGDMAELFEDADIPQQKGPYFPRIVTSRPGGAKAGLTRGSSVGGKAFFEKPRLFETEAEGWARGYQYEPNITSRLATRTERLYKRIADKRLADDGSLGGISRKEVEAQLKASFAEELVSGEMADKKIAQMADSIEARGRVFEPAFFGKIFPEETAAQLNKAFPKSQSGLRQAAASLNNALKGLQLGLDLGVGFIQGQALLARHPGIWAKAQFNSLTALFHVEQFPNYVRNNLVPVRELAQLGSGVGRLEEYMAGLGEKELLSRIPGVQSVTAPFARQFQTFLDVAKVEMWKAYRETTPREQWSDVAQTLESVLSGGRMEGIGISQNRALTERALLLAPAYYRGGLNMVAAMGEKGASGQVARRAMVAYATAGGVLFYGLGKALGMSDDELKQRMNPARSDFMMWRIKTKDRISNVGFGGFYRSLLRLMGNTAKVSMDNPESWKSLSPNKNPITKWYRGHAGPVAQQVWDQFSGKDYMGEDTDLSTTRRAVTPLALEALRKRPGQPSPTAAEVAQTFVGLQGYPATSKSELNKLHKDWLADNKDPKVKADFERKQKMSFPSSKYSDLNSALADKDEKAISKSIQDLQADGVKRSDIFKRMNPYSADGSTQKPLFHESARLEAKFRKSLSPEQVKLYEEARKDRKDQWQLFLKAWREDR